MPDRDKWIYGKGQSKSTGLYKDVTYASKGSQPHSTTPDDWPWSKEAKKKYGKNIAFNKPLPEVSDDEDVEAWFKRVEKERKERERRYKREVKLGTEWKTRNLDWIAVLPDASHPGKVRIQRYDEDGFSGHTTFDNLQKLVAYLIEWETSLKKANGTMDKFSKTARWKRGMKRLAAFHTKESSVEDLVDRIDQLLERAARIKPILMFHGTASKNLRSILKKGFVPNPKERVWQDDPNAAQSYQTVTRKTVGGTYFSTNLNVATSSALTAAQKSKSEQLVIVAKIQPRSGYADEDDIIHDAKRGMKKAMFPSGHIGHEEAWPRRWIEFVTSPGEAKKAIQKFAKEFKVGLEADLPQVKKIPLAPKAVEDMFWGLLEQVVAKWYSYNKKMPYGADYYAATKRLNLSREQEHKYYALVLKRLKRVSLQKAEKRYLSAADKLTRQLSKLAIPKPDAFRTNVRITDPVNFRGKNKIIAVFEMRSGEDYKEDIKVHYGKIPSEVKSALNQNLGDWREVDKFETSSWWTKANNESAMTFSDPKTTQEKKALKMNRKKSEQQLISKIQSFIGDTNEETRHNTRVHVRYDNSSTDLHNHVTELAIGKFNWKPLRDTPIGPVKGYEATGSLKGRAKIEKRKVGRAQRWFLVLDGKDYPMPGKKASLDHAEGTIKKMLESTALDLIEQVIQGESPSELIEKVSYAYDIRLDQNIRTGPVVKLTSGHFGVASAHNYATEYVCEAKKVKAVWSKGATRASIRKWPLTGRKADQYKDGTWAWVTKLVDNWSSSSTRRPKLVINVLVWDMDGKPVHKKLGQEFTAKDLKAAKSYAKKLIEDGLSRMTSVEGRVIMPYEEDQIVNFGTFEPARSYGEALNEVRKKRTPFYQMGKDAFESGVKSPAPILNKKVFGKISKIKSDKERMKAMKDYQDGWQQANLDSPLSESIDEAKGKKRKVGGRMEYALRAAADHGITAGGSFASFSLFHKMREAELIHPPGSGAWKITDKGKQALKDGFYYA